MVLAALRPCVIGSEHRSVSEHVLMEYVTYVDHQPSYDLLDVRLIRGRLFNGSVLLVDEEV